MKPFIYVAGKYSASTPAGIRINIEHAQEWAAAINKTGLAYAVCPHSLSDGIAASLSEEGWISFTRELSQRCNALAMIPGWYDSDGARGELDANRGHIPYWNANMCTLADVPHGVRFLVEEINLAKARQ